jgi:hypothetical protein
MYKGKTFVPNLGEIKNTVLREMHNVPYVVDFLVASDTYFHKGMCFACGSSRKYSSLEFTLVRRN